ncbi:MAG: hypothetical protein ACYDB1_01150 [Acidiferrobacteraceae bacterium]
MIEELDTEARRQKFRELIASGVSTQDAGRVCNYTEGTAREYRRRDREIIRQLSIEHVQDLLPVAVNQLRALVMSAKSEAVQLNAIARVFTQAGLDVPATVNLHTLSDQELDVKIKEALGVTPAEFETLLRKAV